LLISSDSRSQFLTDRPSSFEGACSKAVIRARVLDSSGFRHQRANPKERLGPLCVRRDWARNQRAAEQGNEIAPFQLMELHPMPTSRDPA
jgi:hypothetical protein